MESIKLQDLLEWFIYGPNECRTSHCSHGLCLAVGDGPWTSILYEKWVTTRKSLGTTVLGTLVKPLLSALTYRKPLIESGINL